MAEWAVFIPEDLAKDLKMTLMLTDYPGHTDHTDKLILVMDRIGKLAVEVFANEHSPPHFRVRCAEGSCRFSIKDGMPLDPDGLSKYFRVIRKWHKDHKQDLINAWNSMRPTDCPVGEYRE